ncbi:MAG: Penicillin-binding protein, 1A family [Candidatus Levybacteria bacterium GW2011_GWC2_37_7]|nr:MAG: Penicillin-binding protein, 1A family [Candidatus Levybacteria bacterium GW2011_GWC2_37_7]
MKTATQILFYILQFLTFVGDITLFVLKIPLLILRYLQLMSSNSWRIIKYKSTRIKKRKKIKAIKIFPLPVAIRIKYFLMGSIFSLLFFFIPLTIIIFLQELPNPKQLNFQQTPLTTKIFDRNGVLLYQIYAQQNRTLVPLSSIPKHLQQASIAIEDKNFYKNSGIDITAIVRAAIADISGKPLQGGSTITQQLIKSTLLTPEISINRKIKEIILAFWADRIYTKDQILEMYFNQAPYGGTAWGIEAASEVYFNLKASDLDLAQSAFLAGITRAPTNYSPFGESPNSWKTRQEEVLTRMEQLKYISLQEKNDALKEDLIFSNPESPIYAPHFVMYVKDLLVKKYGLGMVEKGGLHVTTSLDLKTQDMAQKIVTSEVEKNAYLNLTNGAAIVTNPGNGDILAMVGSKDYSDLNSGNFNVVTALRQPGSSIKVVTYSAALASGFTAATILDDSPVSYTSPGSPVYSPVNYDGKFRGKMSLRIALANSINIPAIKTLSKIGIQKMIDLGKKMGITTWNNPENYGLAITLGAAETKMTDMATVYGVLANGGYKVNLNPILKITDSKGNVLEEKNNPPAGGEKTQIIDPGVAFIISNILADNAARAMEFGTNSPLNIPNHNVSVKTGTSDNKRDNWTIGYTPDFVVAAWVGNNDNSPMSQYLASGITGAAPIWHDIMVNLLSNSNSNKITVPPNVIQKDCIGRKEYFIKGTENSVNCTFVPTPTPQLQASR